MSAKVERMFEEVGAALTKLERLFTPDAKLTFIARFDGAPESDVFISIDDPAEVGRLVGRTVARAAGDRQHIHMGADAPSNATPDDATNLERLAAEAGLEVDLMRQGAASLVYSFGTAGVTLSGLGRFAEVVRADAARAATSGSDHGSR